MQNRKTYTFDEIVMAGNGGWHPAGLMYSHDRVVRCAIEPASDGDVSPVLPEPEEYHAEMVGGQEVIVGTSSLKAVEGRNEDGEWVAVEECPTEGWRHMGDCPCDDCLPDY